MSERGVPRARAWAVAVVATLAMSVSYIDRQALAAIAPAVRAGLHVDAEQYGWLAGAFSMTYLVGAPLAGVLLDRVGARRGLAIALLAWSAIAGAHALAASFAVLFALRIALGAAEAPSFPGAAQTIRRVLPPERRSAGFGLLFTGSSIGSMVAAPLAIALNTRFGWQTAFLLTAVLGLAWLPAWWRVTSDPAVRARLVPASAATGGASTSRARLLFTAPVLRAVVLVVLSAPAIMFVLNWWSQYLVEARHMPQAALGPYLAVPPLFFDAGAVAFGALASRRDRAARGEVRSHWPLIAVAALLASTLAIVPRAVDPWGAVAIASMSMAGGGALYALLTADMLARVDAAHVSTTGGLTAAAQSLAYVIANPIVGRVVKETGSYDAVCVTLGLAVLPGALAWLLWPMPQRSAGATAAGATEPT